MKTISLFFSPRGRATRSQYWNVQIAWVALLMLTIWLATLGPDVEAWTGPRIATTILFVAIVLGSVWSGICVGIKRFHDRDKSGLWMLIFLIPVVGSLWGFIEIGFLRGQRITNAFGPPPGASA